MGILTIFCFRPSDSLPSRTPNATVDNNKNGDYTKIQEASDNAPSHGTYRYVIYIKEGIYNENITVWQERPNITLVADGKNRTIISSSLSNGTGHTIEEATIVIHGSGFLTMNLIVRNVVGAKNRTTVAVLSNSTYSAFYRVSIEGYQDTLYIKKGPQLFTECDIYGTVDFIFGEGPAVFQKCQIFAKQSPIPLKQNAISENGCFYPRNTICGFSFHRCKIDGDTDLLSSSKPTPTFLGRSWINGSKTIFMESSMSSVVNQTSWLEWPNRNYEKTVYFAEFNNTGK
ncbi:Plant invertase/pectin methylesterase inhibitor superfamily [Euphorbia peplus]|nr:Plant invertase/pectin methylesterase inhibitor superfamily [Euphorbia peplus]